MQRSNSQRIIKPYHQHRRPHGSSDSLPINLLRKNVRERRNRGEYEQKKKRRRKRFTKKHKLDFLRVEHDALVRATEQQLKQILAENEVLSDIYYDSTPDELLGEIALANGEGTTVYVQRDGLSTLTIVLPQKSPTIANLKRAIETTSRAQLMRELRERHEERLRRRHTGEPIAAQGRSDSNVSATTQQNRTQQQQVNAVCAVEPTKVITGELVYSAARNGHKHRSNVSWRFLWRAFALFNLNTHKPLNDKNGRKLLSDCGVENASTLKFCKREAYFGRKRQ